MTEHDWIKLLKRIRLFSDSKCVLTARCPCTFLEIFTKKNIIEGVGGFWIYTHTLQGQRTTSPDLESEKGRERIRMLF
jgi:hypothetical protein